MTNKQILGSLWRVLIRRPKYNEDSFRFLVCHFYVQATIKKSWSQFIWFYLVKISEKF